MLASLQVTIQLGLLYAFMSLGVYITFRILKFPDLTVDGSFTTGGGIAAVMIVHGYEPWLAVACAFAGVWLPVPVPACSIRKARSTVSSPGS